MTSTESQASGINVVVGLGNPGKQYRRTRHNVGFMIVEELGRKLGVPFQERLFRATWGMASIGGRRVLLCMPTTYMNRSGETVVEVLRYYRFQPREMLVVHDDLDLECGRLRLVRQGGAGGHRGVESIIQNLGKKDFPRLKLGIGRPVRGEAVESYVLAPPYSAEQKGFDDMIELGVEAVESVVVESLETAMNRYNQKLPSLHP